MYAHFNEPPPPIHLARPDCPPKIAAAVMRMLEKEPDQRFSTIDTAVAAIGGAPLAPDDPIRTQMMTLAAQSDSMKLLQRFTTPVSQPSAVLSGGGPRRSIATLLISPARATVNAGGEVQLLVSAKARDGQTIANRPVSWASTNTRVARVSPTGLVTAVRPGTVTITASSGNTSATTTVTVTAARSRKRTLALAAGARTRGNRGVLWLSTRSDGGPHRVPAIGQYGGTPDCGGAGLTHGVHARPAAAPTETTSAPPPTAAPPVRPRETVPRTRDSAESTVATALASARAARVQAVEAGAVDADLDAGDDALRVAQQLRQAGRRAEAFAHLRQAAGLFAVAESTATAARVAAARRVPAPDTPKVVPPPTTSTPPEVNPEPAIRGAIDA
jgi:hypothetical protein